MITSPDPSAPKGHRLHPKGYEFVVQVDLVVPDPCHPLRHPGGAFHSLGMGEVSFYFLPERAECSWVPLLPGSGGWYQEV